MEPSMEDMAAAVTCLMRIPSTLRHRVFRTLGPLVPKGNYVSPAMKETTLAKANLVSSCLSENDECPDFFGRVLPKPMPSSLHAPVLDIDVPCSLVPSSTPGHYHLFIDQPMAWKKYKHLLQALASAGIIEEGFCKASVMQGHSTVRVPWVKK
jgi:hypothetical protein